MFNRAVIITVVSSAAACAGGIRMGLAAPPEGEAHRRGAAYLFSSLYKMIS